jgi:hypothetical protein
VYELEAVAAFPLMAGTEVSEGQLKNICDRLVAAEVLNAGTEIRALHC